MSGPFFKVGEIWREENKHNLQICHVAASTPRVNQGVQPWVSQRPLASVLRRLAWVSGLQHNSRRTTAQTSGLI
jgi:hypothetical protein